MSRLSGLEKESGKARLLLRGACEKYAEAVKAKPKDSAAWWNWGNDLVRLADLPQDEDKKRSLCSEACEKYDNAVEADPNKSEFWFSWGSALGKLAELETDDERKRELLGEACEKFANAVEIDPQIAEAWYNRGVALVKLADLEKDDTLKRASLLDQAEQAALNAYALAQGKVTYILACIASLRGDKEKCREWLEKAEELGVLPTSADLDSDTDMDPVREEAWFKALLERMLAQEASEEDGEA